MTRPWLSVIMPIRNGENYLDHALQSVLSQRDDGIEVIAVEGGSTDKTVDILNAYRGRLHLRLLSAQGLDNWVDKTNHGLAHARGDYVCFLHHDDLWAEDRLRVLRATIEKAPDATMFLHPSWFIDPEGKRVGLWRCPLAHGVELEPEFVVRRLFVQNFISIPAPLFSRKQALLVGGLDPALPYTADWDFWLKMTSTGKTYYHPRALSSFRIHPHSQTIEASLRLDDFRRQLDVVLDRHLDRRDVGRIEHPRLRRVARFSIEVNTGLAALAHGFRSNPIRLLSEFLGLGPAGWHQYLRDSRIIERTLPRYRIGLAHGPLGSGRLPNLLSVRSVALLLDRHRRSSTRASLHREARDG